MVNISWCLNVKNGIELVNPSENVSESYLSMAGESLEELKKVESKIWIASTAYYSMYYSLYSLMMRIGVKCEIHSCSIEFMNYFLKEFYSSNERELIETCFRIRNTLQYYPQRFVDNKKLEFVRNEAVNFYVKTKEIISKISESQVKKIREELKNYEK